MKNFLIFYIAASTVIFSGSAFADLNDSSAELCDKVKSCALAEVKAQGLPEGMVQMMVGMFEGMCATWVEPYAATVDKAGLEDKAIACIDSVVSESCAALMKAKGAFRTKECDEFEQAADEAGVDLGR